MTLTTGTKLDGYEVLGPLGAGGMGEVYRARDSVLKRDVAIKVLPSVFSRDPDRLRRFEQEAQAAAALNHPNILVIYQFGTFGNAPYLVSELLEGSTLREQLARSPMPVHKAIDYGVQIACGLAAAHEKGIVHRDLKPENIFVTKDQRAKILDFGLAKLTHADAATPDGDTVTLDEQTDPGQILGTVGYMSPEQVRGKAADHRTDIFAFGAILYEMVTGKRAFRKPTSPETMTAILNDELPDISQITPGTPLGLLRVMRRCLEKNPERRFQSASDLAFSLESLPDSDVAVNDDHANVSTTRKGHAAVAGILGFVVGSVLIAALGWWIVRPGSAPLTMRFSAVTSFAGVQAQPALSPDGRSVAFTSNRDGHYNTYVGLLRGGGLVQITHDAAMKSRPMWSPDGSTLAYAQLNESGTMDVWEVAALGGLPRKVMLNGTDPAWTPDGRSLIYANYADGQIWICGVSGENPRLLVRMKPAEVATELRISPDGKMVAMAIRSAGGGPTGKLGIADLSTGEVRLLTKDSPTTLSPAWSSDNRFIYFASSRGGTLNIWKVGADGNGLRQVTAGAGDDTELDVSSDGKHLVFATMRLNIGLSQFDTQVRAGESSIKVLTSDPARNEFGPAYSPDGTHLAFFTNLKGVEHESIGMADANGGNATQLVRDDRTNLFPRWSPDGNRIVYFSFDDQGRNEDYRSIAISGGAPQTIIRSGGNFIFDVGRDGRVLYQKDPGKLQAYDPRDGRSLILGNVPEGAWLFRWSSDGNSVAYLISSSRENDPDAGVWITDFKAAPRQVFRGWACWLAVDAKNEIFVLKGEEDLNGEIWKVKWDGSGLSRAPGFLPLLYSPNYLHSRTISQFDVSPDGLHIAFQAQQVLQENIGIIDNVQ